MFKRWLDYSVRRQLLDMDLEDIKCYMHQRVMEIGCGSLNRRGQFKLPVSKLDQWITVDVQKAVRPALLADVECLPVKSENFDVVIAIEMLEYVINPTVALKEMNRILKPGGIVIVSTPFMHRMDTSSDRWRFTQAGLQDLLVGAGFRIEKVTQQGSALAVVVNIIKFVVANMPWNIGRKLLTLGMYPPLSIILRLDNFLGKRIPVLKTFSTGYLIVAVKPEALSGI